MKWHLRLRNMARYASAFGLLGAWDIFRSRGSSGIASVRVRGVRSPVWYRVGTCDLSVMQQIFGRAEPLISLTSPPRLIIDAGANIGCTSLSYATRWPSADILAIEPDTENCELFKRNLEGYPKVTLVQAALWHRRGELQIANPNSEPFARRVEDVGAGRVVPACTVSDLLAGTCHVQIDLLKLDIEGSELEVLKNSEDWIERVGTLMVELHDRFRPGCREAFEQAIQGCPQERSIQGEYHLIRFLRSDVAEGIS